MEERWDWDADDFTCPVNGGHHRYDADGRCEWCDAEDGKHYEVYNEEDEADDLIADAILSKHEMINEGTGSIWCWLFGHSWSFSARIDLNRKIVTLVGVCKRCDKVNQFSNLNIEENE